MTLTSLVAPDYVAPNIELADTASVNGGTAFGSTIAGAINGIWFYRATISTAVSSVSLWQNDGTLIVTKSVTVTAAQGWQYQAFDTPVLIAANTIYVASMYLPGGQYMYELGKFATQFNHAPLYAPANSVYSNGRFVYSGAPAFPSSSGEGNFFGADVVFDSLPSPTDVGQIVVSWTASTDTSVTGYYVYYDTTAHDPGAIWTDYAYSVDVSGRTTVTTTLINLIPGTTYYLNISAHGSGGHDAFESDLFGETSFVAYEPSASISLSGAGIALATATGVINQSVELSASAASIAVANGAVSMEITLAGDGFVEAFASGALAQAMALEGAAQATADSAGGVAATVDLAANAAATATSTGQVSLTMSLSGAALIEALAMAGLDPGGQGLAADAAAAVASTGDIAMTTEASAAAQAIADAASAVSIDTALDAAATVQANAMGDLTPGAAGFAADAQATATAEAALFATVPLLGDAVVTVTGSAGVSIDMPIASAAVSVAAGTGDLTVGLGGLSAEAIAEALAGGNITMMLTVSADALISAVVGASLTVLGVYRLPVGIYRISSLTPIRQIRSLTRAN